MINYGIRLSFGLLACVVVTLAAFVSCFSRAAETNDEDLISSGEDVIAITGSDDTPQQLDHAFKSIDAGLEPESEDEAGEGARTKCMSGLFKDSEKDVEETVVEAAPMDDTSASGPATADAPSADTWSADTEQRATAIKTQNPTTVEPIVPETKMVDETVDRAVVAPVAIDPIPPVSNSSNPTHQASSTPETLTLDALLQRVYQKAHLKDEAVFTRLDERRRLAIQLRSTLEAAEQVARFGEAGSQLLRDASLDTIVATMVAAREQEREEPEELASASSTVMPLPVVAPIEAPAAEDVTGFEAWRPVYIIRDSQGQRIGWRHLVNDERLTIYVGETSMFDDDHVEVIGVSHDARGRLMRLKVNGEDHEILLF